MTSKLMKFFAALVMLAVTLPASAWKDIKVDLTNRNLLTEAEVSDKTLTTFGVAIADDGTPSRVAADDPTAAIVLTGKYHSDQHGWGNFSSTVKVDGPVKISMGTCQWGGDVTVKNPAGETVGTFTTKGSGCYSANDPLVASCSYLGGATTLTIAGGSYTPYIAVEAIEGDLPSEYTVTYAAGDYASAGEVPVAVKSQGGAEVTIPGNYTMYVEGKTLTGWTDGTNVYAIGEKFVPAADVTLTPVFTDNATSLAARKSDVTVRWDFQRVNGAPTVGYQNKAGIWVAQADVDGEKIDVKVDFSTSPGKIANANWTDWAQMNEGTSFVLPSCKGATFSIETYSAASDNAVNGEKFGDGTTKTPSIVVLSEDPTATLVIGKAGSYYRWIQVVLPYIKPSAAGTTYENETASVLFKMDNMDDLNASVVAPENGFSLVAFNQGGAIVKGSGSFNSRPEIVFPKFQPANGESDQLEWSVKPAKGLTFVPAKISGDLVKFGTDAAAHSVTVSAVVGGNTLVLGTYTPPRNNKTQAEDKFGKEADYAPHFEIVLTADQQKQLTASEDALSVFATIGVNSAKQAGFANIAIDGTLSGTIAEVTKYTVEAKAEPADAAVVSVSPKAESYDEGSVVKVSAEKNFGYQFVNWTDAEGKVVSTDASFNHEVVANAVLTANYTKLQTYELAYGVEGGANDYMVQPVPAPTVVDGKNMYEEGTSVTLTAISNPVVTFTNWNDGQSSSEITVKMDADKSYTAVYSTIDFVAGWDFYRPGADGRAADFYSADNDAAALVMRTADGSTSGWLDKSQMGAGGYEGRPGAVNWRTTGLGEYYWQTTVNAEAFTDLKLITAMLYNYNAYTKYNLEYSLDGETWKNFGSVNISGSKNWTDVTASLPAETNNAKALSIRWIADKSSAVDGTTSNNDGIALGASFITGTKKLVDDGTAPVLVSFIPEEGSNNASINGKIVLNFDEKVKVKEGTVASLGGVELTPEVTGKVVMFPYKNLAYATDYTFVLAANTVSDLTDNYLDKAVKINFTTKTRPEVEKALYDFIVPDQGSFQDAVAAAAKRGDTTKRFRVFMRDGNYKTLPHETNTKTNTKSQNGVVIATETYNDPTTYISSPNISFIGESRDGVVITNTLPNKTFSDGSCVAEGIGQGDVIRINKEGANSYWQNLTIKSSMGDAKGRDIELNDGSDKTIMKDVCLWGYQDTYVSNSERSRFYFEGGLLRGRTDFLCGKGDVYYNAVTLQMCDKGGYLAVPSVPKKYGYVFKDCEIVGENDNIDGNYTLGRPWGKGTPIALFIDTKMTVKPSAVGWNEMSGGWPARFAEYNSTTASGTVIDLSQRKKVFASTHENNPVLTKAEADASNYNAVMGGDDDWDPASLAEQAPAPTNVTIDGTSLTWDNSNYALLWAIVKNGKVVDFVIEPAYTVDDPAATYAVRAANEMGGLGEAVAASSKSGLLDVEVEGGIVSTRWYNAEGMEVSADYQGVVIRVDVMTDGSTRASKVVNR